MTAAVPACGIAIAIIRFAANITETVHLRALDGKPVASNWIQADAIEGR